VRRSIGALLALVAVLAPLAAVGWVVRHGDALPGVATRTSILWGAPTVITGDERLPASLAVRLGSAPQLVAPNWSGLVTEATARGIVVSDGTVIGRVDGIQRRVCVSANPLFRTMALGTTGDDVTVLRHCLATLTGRTAAPAKAATAVDPALVASINQAAAIIGAPANGAFDPSWVLWTPAGGWTLSTVALSVGAPAPAPGADVGIGQAPLLGGTVSVTDDPTTGILSSAAQAGETLLFSVNALNLSVRADSNLDPVQAANVTTALVALASASGGGTSGGGTSGGGTSGTGQNAGAPATVNVTGVLILRGGQRLQLPVTAIVTDAAGRTCVMARDVEGSSAVNPVAAVVRPAGLGLADVSGAVSANTVVALNPADLAGHPSCG
jgi:hypothetical protein